VTPKRIPVEDPQRLVARFPGSLKKRLLHRAIEEGRPYTLLLIDAVEAYLSKHEKGRP